MSWTRRDVLGNTTLRLERGGTSASLTARHVAKRYFTILNTEIGAGVHDHRCVVRLQRSGRVGAFDELNVRLNAMNLGDESYISTMGTNGFSLTADQETLQAGSQAPLLPHDWHPVLEP